METIIIDDRESYNYVVSRGYQPLLDIKLFKMDIRLRVEIQRELFGYCVFGRGNIPQANERFLGGFGNISRTNARKHCARCRVIPPFIVRIS